MGLEDLIPGVSAIKMALSIFGVVSLLGLGGYVWYELKQVEVLEKKIELLETNNKVLQDNVNTTKNNLEVCLASNNQNLTTINELKAERNDAIRARDEMVKLNVKIGNNALNVSRRIQEMSLDDKNDGPISPVLKEAINAIQTGELSK